MTGARRTRAGLFRIPARSAPAGTQREVTDLDKGFMWCYMLRLGDHTSDDASNPPRGIYLPKVYREEMETEEAAWDEIVAFLPSQGINAILVDVLDGVRMDSHPEIAVPNAWSKEVTKRKLDEARALGLTPIPKLNFSAGHSVWLKQYRRMISTPVYYEVCRDLIDETCELFGRPALFHLGLDEEMPANQKDNEMILVRSEELRWHDYEFLFDCCGRNGARPWVWSDYYWTHPEEFRRRMPKDVLQSNWFYFNMLADGATCEPAGWEPAFRAFEELEALGYDQVPTGSTWANETAMMQVAAHCSRIVAPERLKGFLTASWARLKTDNLWQLKNDAFRLGEAARTVSGAEGEGAV